MHPNAYADIPPIALVNRAPFDDYELYPSPDPCTDPAFFPNAAQFQLQSSQLQSVPKADYFPTYTSWTDGYLPPHIADPLSVTETGLHSVLLGPDRVASPWSSYSSISGAESPGSSSDGSFAQSNTMESYPSPPYAYDDSRAPSVKGGEYSSSVMSATSSVALPQIQTYPDPEPMVETSHPLTAPAEPFVYEENNSSEGVEATAVQAHHCVLDSLPSHKPPSPSLRRRKSRCSPQKSSPPNRVTKTKTRDKSHTKAAPASKQQATKSTTKGKSPPNRVFVCSFSHYGCTGIFTSKNEWKRHIASQHVQLGFFRCDVGNCNGGHKPNSKSTSTSPRNHHTNDFNRKDLFTQHQRRMHAPWVLAGRPDATTEQERQAFETSLEDVRARCWHEQRKPPQQSSCGFCGRDFSGPNSWNDRMDHVGRHFEKDEAPLEEAEDIALRNWAITERIIQHDSKGQWVLTALC